VLDELDQDLGVDFRGPRKLAACTIAPRERRSIIVRTVMIDQASGGQE
jgi:hypothetical protein